MKRCPQCRRDYYDDSLLYCLDDGAALLEGPSSGDVETAVLPAGRVSSETATRTLDYDAATRKTAHTASKRNSIIAVVLGIILVTALGVGSYFYYGRGPSKQIESIAVMPFVNDTGGPDLEYLSDGITESLINSLSQIPTITVKARSSVFTYKGKEISLRQVAKDLSVQAVLNGRVQQRGDQVLLNVELVDAGTGDQIWGDQYIRKLTDLIQLQSDIARDVSGKLKEKLTGAEQQKVAKSYTENTEAYQLYLKGRYHWNKRRPDDIRKSVEYFQQAIDRDPTYALAYAALAEGYIVAAAYRVGNGHENYPKARAAAQKAIEIDPTLAEGHNALASVLSNEWRFAEAEAEWEKALELNPNYATAHQWYAEQLNSMGRYPEALGEIKRAQQVDPLSLIINGLVGVTLRLNGHIDECLAQLNKTLELDPNFPRTHLFLAETYEQMGRYDDAVDEFSKALVQSGTTSETVAHFAPIVKNAAKTGGAAAYARAFANVLEQSKGASEPPAAILAGYWARAGEIDKCFEILERAVDQHDDSVLMLKDPKLNAIKSDPRYKELLRRVGLPE
jgi:TolB-like protein/Tfp pilus assembly protein PilF